MAIAAFACAVRPTSAIIWLYVGLIELLTSSDRLKFVFLEAAPIGLVLLLMFFYTSSHYLGISKDFVKDGVRVSLV